MKTLVIACIIIAMLGCGKQQSFSERLKEKFCTNETAMNEIVNELNSTNIDSVFPGYSAIPADRFNYTLSAKLTSVGVKEVSFHSTSCSGKSSGVFIFKTNWVKGDSAFIAKIICDTTGTKIGAYSKDRNSNEYWGLGDHWVGWKIVKYLN